MLIVTRRPGQKLVINDNIVLHVISVDGGAVKLGIEAPPEIKVLRKELIDRRDKKTTD